MGYVFEFANIEKFKKNQNNVKRYKRKIALNETIEKYKVLHLMKNKLIL